MLPDTDFEAKYQRGKHEADASRSVWLRSIKEKISVPIDRLTTILIGPNDNGKTNLLRAVQCLNDDVQITANDRNWDLPEEAEPAISFEFQLDAEDRSTALSSLKADLCAELGAAAHEVTLSDDPEHEAFELSVVLGDKVPEPPSVNNSAVSSKDSISESYVFPNTVVMTRSAGREIEVIVPEVLNKPRFKKALLSLRPRVELFAHAEQLMDVITLAQLEDPSQEFMQGIFRRAGIWGNRQRLFQQNPATERALERASREFTEKLRIQWQQGSDLDFRLSHAGQNGNQIQLLISDPAVKERFVRPSERSAGFTAFFALSMRLLARTEANPANKYIFLFDEPGTALHPHGQINLQRVFEQLSKENQIIYSTHSLLWSITIDRIGTESFRKADPVPRWMLSLI